MLCPTVRSRLLTAPFIVASSGGTIASLVAASVMIRFRWFLLSFLSDFSSTSSDSAKHGFNSLTASGISPPSLPHMVATPPTLSVFSEKAETTALAPALVPTNDTLLPAWCSSSIRASNFSKRGFSGTSSAHRIGSISTRTPYALQVFRACFCNHSSQRFLSPSPGTYKTTCFITC